jgi:GYF domain 2
MASEWYIARDGNKVGPLSSAQLRELAKTGQLKPADMLWKKGKEKWVTASTINGLFQSDPETSSIVKASSPPAAKPSLIVAPTVAPSGVAKESGRPATGQIRATAQVQLTEPATPYWKDRKFLLIAGGGLGAAFVLGAAFSACLMLAFFGVGDRRGTDKQANGVDKKEIAGKNAGAEKELIAEKAKKPKNATTAAEAKAELLEVAKKMEGEHVGAWFNIQTIDLVEKGARSIGDVDREMLRYTPETQAAYRKWRSAWLAESKK